MLLKICNEIESVLRFQKKKGIFFFQKFFKFFFKFFKTFSEFINTYYFKTFDTKPYIKRINKSYLVCKMFKNIKSGFSRVRQALSGKFGCPVLSGQELICPVRWSPTLLGARSDLQLPMKIKDVGNHQQSFE